MARTKRILKAKDIERLENTSFASAIAGGDIATVLRPQADASLGCVSMGQSDCCVSVVNTACGCTGSCGGCSCMCSGVCCVTYGGCIGEN